jgi:hypothetical protein
LYAHGKGVPNDETEAARLWRKAAELGDSTAMAYLGIATELGRGVIKDEAAAKEWYDKAAAQGNEDGRKNAARLEAKWR